MTGLGFTSGPVVHSRALLRQQHPQPEANAVQTGTSMNELKREDWGRLLLRLSIGGLMLFHGFEKLTGGVDGIAG